MAIDTKEIGIYVRKGLIFSIRTCHRSMREHPVFWGVGFFFLFLYRCFPFLFGFLVSSSPVLICTAVLLGTLLSFGNPHIPEVEREEKTTHGIASLKTGVFKNDVVVKKDEIFSVEARVEKKDKGDEKAVEEASPVGEGRDYKVEKEVLSSSSSTHGEGLMGSTVVPGEEPKGTLGGKQVVEEKEREFCSSKVVEKREFQEESVSRACEDVEDQFSENQKDAESLKEEIEQQAGKLPDIQLEDHADTSQNFSWKLEEEHADSDSESDHAESSSPDASMADIIPMLDELHPLLELEASQKMQDSDAASEHSHGSDDGSAELEEETENQEEEEDEDDEEVQGEQEISAKSVVMWTEDDQKNLIDLGTSELERNQRLENLIAKRSARKALRMEAEKNLIDLDSNDPPFYVAPILTTRNNPFDLPYDSNESMGLPAIPGSAPSVLLPRRNPFDLPYDSLEEKPNLIGDDAFQKEFMAINQNDTFFRRHESFSLGACVEHKKKKRDIKMKPYFVTEQMAFEDEEYPIFQRQSRDKGDSKLSSALETESLYSEEDHEDQRSIEQDSSQETEQIFHVDHMSDHVECESHTFGEVGSVEIEQEEKRDVHISNETEPILPVIESITSPTTPDKNEEEERDVHVSYIEVKVADEENCHETEPILPVTESITSPMIPDKIEEEKRDVHVSNFEVKVADEENGHETEPIFPVTGSRTSPMTPDKIEEEKRDVHISNNEVKVADEENCHETEPILPVTESKTSPMAPDKIEEEERDVHLSNDEVKVADEENGHETEPILPVTGSLTSPMTPDKIEEEKRDVHINNNEVKVADEENCHETEPILPVTESINSPMTPDKIEEEERDVHLSNDEMKMADEENGHATEPILPVTESITSSMTPDKIEEEKRDVHISNNEVKVADEENCHETEPILPVTESITSPMTPDKFEEEERDVHVINNEVKVADEENCHETEPILLVTESVTSPMTPDKIEEEERDVHVSNNEVKVADEENCHETPILPVTESITSPMIPDKIEIHVEPEIVEDDSGASFSSLSEMDAKKFLVNTDEESGNLKSTISDQTQSPGGSMQSSLTEEKIYFRTQAAEGLHENQTKEPVYDSSSGEIEKNLSNITSIEGCICVDKGVPVSFSSISSDKQAEISEVGSTHMSIERADGEQEFHNGSIREEMAPAIGLQATSLDLCAVDEHELETRKVTELSEHGVIEVGFSGANQNSDTPNVPVVPELVVEKVSVVSTSSDNSELIVDDPVQEELNPHFEQDHSSSSSLDPETHVGTHQYDSNQKMDTVDSSFSAVENSASHELEEVLPLIEKLKPVPYSVGDHEETQGPSTPVLNSLGEANTINARELVAQDPDNKDLSNLSPLIPLPVFVTSGVSENKSTEDLMDGLDEIDKNNSQFEHLDDAGEAVYPHATKEFSENADEIKEIDEELLLELDKVGDFSFKEFESTRNKIEEQSNLEVHESISTMQVSEGNLEDSVTLVKCRSGADQSTKSGDSHGVPEKSHRHFDVNSTSEVQVLEESSMDDIDSVIKQPEGEDVEESIVLEPLKYEQLPEESEVGFDELKLINQDLIPINNSSQLPVEEAGSVEDYDSTFKQLHEVQQTTVTVSLNDKPVKEENEVRYTEALHDKLLKESAAGSIESGKSDGEFNATMTNFELPVLEARSFEDIKLAFKQLHEEGADFEIPVLPEPNDNKPHVVEFQHPNEIGSDMQIVEARSLEDIHSTLKVPLVYNMENLNYSEVEDGSAKVEAQELESTGVVDLRFAESEETNLSAEGSNHGVKEKVDSSSLNESGENYNKERSYESSSGSNTSDS